MVWFHRGVAKASGPSWQGGEGRHRSCRAAGFLLSVLLCAPTINARSMAIWPVSPR
ncbi:hypothetical protein DVDV_3515 [Desulfovibrio sp. DV]|nr:hypothetical protein DVDV_3515 [Desulfovibrio sp. DV]